MPPPESDVDEDQRAGWFQAAYLASATADDLRQAALDVVGRLAEAFPDDPIALHIQASFIPPGERLAVRARLASVYPAGSVLCCRPLRSGLRSRRTGRV